MANLLVTGGAGFIGSNFVQHWIERYPQDRVVIIDALTYAGNLANLKTVDDHAGYRFVHGNILDVSLVVSLLREEAIDTIVHFAAESHVDRSIIAPDAFLETNAIGTHNLLKAASQVWLGEGTGRPHRFHHVSTDEVFGSLGPDDPPFSETTPYAPSSPYAASKAASDHLVRAYHKTYGLKVTLSNCSNNYGPFQFPEKLIPLVIVNILQGKQLPVYGDGSNIRDWIYVSDCCLAIESILKQGISGETYNVGGNAECDNLALVNQLCGIVDQRFADYPELKERFSDAPPAGGKSSSSLIEMVRDRPGHDYRYAIDTTKISTELGFSPSHALSDGLDRTVSWYLSNEEWWRAVMDESYREWIERQYAPRQ